MNRITEGGDDLTVATQIQKAIASVQSVSASMKTFSLETQDKEAKEMFQQLAQTFARAEAGHPSKSSAQPAFSDHNW